jgi:curved DNA-binding protein CbpA
MASAKDHYAILGIARNADPEVVRAAYRALAKKYHPDTANHTNLVGQFQEINEAYLVLSDAERRAQYDQASFEKPSDNPPEKAPEKPREKSPEKPSQRKQRRPITPIVHAAWEKIRNAFLFVFLMGGVVVLFGYLLGKK